MTAARFRWARVVADHCADVVDLVRLSDDGDLDALAAAFATIDDRERQRRQPGETAPGRTSLILAALADDDAHLLHIGDTRAYLFRPAPAEDLPAPLAPTFSPELFLFDGSALICLTWDHSTACELVEMDLIPRDDGRRRARQRVLYRSLGRRPPCIPDLVSLPLVAGDRLLLCTAGLWTAIDDQLIADVLHAAVDPEAACAALTDLVGHRDRVANQTGPDTGCRASLAIIDWTGGAGVRSHLRSPMDHAPKAPGAASPIEVLDRFGRDLTAWAATPAVRDRPIVGRSAELRALLRALLRLHKPNALLVGDPGVGKTWLVEALARFLGSPGCPAALRGKRVVQVSLGSLLAGARYRGDFEERIEAIVTAAREDPDLVLFIDEIHAAMSAGAAAEGAVDAANLLKPALAGGELRLIGATTTREFERFVSRDEAFVRRFEVIRIEEPSRAEALTILGGVKDQLERHHGVTISADSITAAVDDSIRYLADRRLPDKAIDILDMACVRAVSRWLSMSLNSAMTATPDTGQTVERGDVAAVVAERCRLPLDLILLDDSARLAALPQLLGRRVFGQEAALARVAQVIERRFRGLKDPQRPICSLLFAGPTGVGKTALARAIAEILFATGEALIRFDMSEYSEKHSIARLLGAPPGYLGHHQDGQLTAALRRRPNAVVLFDEVDKAHPDVLQILLQILDDGTVRDARGGDASFREAVVVLTTNLAAEPSAARRPIGFGAAPIVDDGDAVLRATLEQHLRPELVGRIDSVVRFRSLDDDAIAAIAAARFAQVVERLLAHDTTAMPPRELRERILLRATASRYGARDVERMVEDVVGAWLAAQPTAAVGPGTVVIDDPRGQHRSQRAILVLRGVADGMVAALLDTTRRHPASADLSFLRHAGDGVLALFGSARAALEVATSAPPSPGLRRVLHWGEIDRAGDGQPIGPALDHALAIARLDDTRLTRHAVLVTHDAGDHLAPPRRAGLTPVGRFELGFSTEIELLALDD